RARRRRARATAAARAVLETKVACLDLRACSRLLYWWAHRRKRHPGFRRDDAHSEIENRFWEVSIVTGLSGSPRGSPRTHPTIILSPRSGRGISCPATPAHHVCRRSLAYG